MQVVMELFNILEKFAPASELKFLIKQLKAVVNPEANRVIFAVSKDSIKEGVPKFLIITNSEFITERNTITFKDALVLNISKNKFIDEEDVEYEVLNKIMGKIIKEVTAAKINPEILTSAVIHIDVLLTDIWKADMTFNLNDIQFIMDIDLAKSKPEHIGRNLMPLFRILLSIWFSIMLLALIASEEDGSGQDSGSNKFTEEASTINETFRTKKFSRGSGGGFPIH